MQAGSPASAELTTTGRHHEMAVPEVAEAPPIVIAGPASWGGLGRAHLGAPRSWAVPLDADIREVIHAKGTKPGASGHTSTSKPAGRAETVCLQSGASGHDRSASVSNEIRTIAPQCQEARFIA